MGYDMDRRHFLGTGLFGAAAMLSACNGPQQENSATVDSAEYKRPYEELGVQLYTVRTLFGPDFRGTLKQIADIGYKDLEFAGFYDHDPSDVKAYMDELGLVSHSGHVQLADMRSNFEQLLETADLMGQTNLIIPWLAPEERTVDGYKRIAELLNTRGEAAKSAGKRVAYHNHEFEFETIDGQVPYDILLNETEPDLVKMEIDLFWAHLAGVDVIDYFNKSPGRFIACHIKDASAAGEMVSVGSGVIDFERIFSHAELAGLERYIVEHDQPADPIASITASYKHLTA